MFGFFSVLALACNLLLLMALLSLMQATLTLPGMAAIALALGMAIDANVLINERIREELRAGATPQARSRPASTAHGPPSSTPTSRR
jgi:preprotein translocase subunit SecD